MDIADHSRLQIRLNTLEVATDLLGPVTNAAIVQQAHARAEVDFQAAAEPSQVDIYGRIYFAERWLVELRAFADALREIAADEAFLPAAKAAADAYNKAFPDLGPKRPLRLVSVGDGVVLAAGPEGYAEFPISADAVAALEAIAMAFIDALPSRPKVMAAG